MVLVVVLGGFSGSLVVKLVVLVVLLKKLQSKDPFWGLFEAPYSALGRPFPQSRHICSWPMS